MVYINKNIFINDHFKFIWEKSKYDTNENF